MNPSKNLGELIARRIFELGDEAQSPCSRIQFKGGMYPLDERNQGGMAEKPLAKFIQDILDENSCLDENQ